MFPEGRALEFLIAAVVALIVVGPKDLPVLLRKFGQFMAKVRAMAAEFRASFDEMARQSELDELRKEVEAMRKGQLADIATHAGAPEVNQAFDEISQGLSDVGVQLNSPMSYPSAAETTIEVKPVAKARSRKAPAKRAAAKKTAASKTPAPKAAGKPKAAPAKAAPAKAPAAEAPAKPTAAKGATPKPRARKTAGSTS
ncbi:MAG: sec-independent protein secretion pathway component TatB [Phenylobacterium sp.]|uniref:Sec-independent protein translocase protein TatB n=1 Tax=Phenylobacterium sp. TaxID=1871053 RepID=UPI00262F149F|nr:Sec-independent protein translocase protein TatB [Phenylobacterium sp.]MDB5499258.1 sec-independent protein secretion pathway component TatB [Phenylobacterium sp.]